jgi:nascent polypeptide-associated complex subunit alpha
MFPGGGRGGMNPKQLSAMMKQMGITMEDIDDVEEVIIRTPREDIVIVEAEVSKMVAKGQGTTWQVAGKETRRPRAPSGPAQGPAQAPGPKYTDDDVALVAEQARVSKDEARKALEAANGETAEAILKLLGDE